MRRIPNFYLLFAMVWTSTTGVYAQETGNLSVRAVGQRERHVYEKNIYVVGGVGYAHRLGKRYDHGNPVANDFASDLRKGYGANISVSYLFKEYWGIGIHSDFVRQAQSATGTLYVDGVGFENYQERNSLLYVGPTVVFRAEGKKVGGLFDFGWGPQFYSNDIGANGFRRTFTKTVFASYLGALVQFRMSDQVGAGIKLSLSGGKMSEQVSTTEKVNFSLTNVMFSGIFAFKSKTLNKK